MELKPLYQKSFYGKAEVKRKGDAEILYSYGTPVLAHINELFQTVHRQGGNRIP